MPSAIEARAGQEEEIRGGHLSVLDRIRSQFKFEAFAADLKGLTPAWEQLAGIALKAGMATVQAVAPGTPAEILKPALQGATVRGEGWLRMLALRLFRPRMYAVYRMAGDAKELTDVLGAASRLFDFEQSYAVQPVDFMRRLSKIAWVA